jgi:pimeloyl-ACP methyl ester carboxylesterase
LGGLADSAGIDPVFMEHFAAMEHLDWRDRDEVVAFMVGIARLSTGSGRTFDVDAAARRAGAEFDRSSTIASAFNHSMVDADESWNSRLAEIEVPVLVIHGSDDPIVPVANAAAIADQAPHAHVLIIDGAGHELNAADIPMICDQFDEFRRSTGR